MKRTIKLLVYTALSRAWRTWAKRVSLMAHGQVMTQSLLRRSINASLRKAVYGAVRKWKEFVQDYHVESMMTDAADAHTRMKTMRDGKGEGNGEGEGESEGIGEGESEGEGESKCEGQSEGESESPQQHH